MHKFEFEVPGVRKLSCGVNIIGGGLAGSEAALVLASLGIKVRLFDLKPEKFTACHHMPYYAELVCSNSLKSNLENTASGLLKAELRALSSPLLYLAETCKVPAGGALAVDRLVFADKVTEKIRQNPLIQCVSAECTDLFADDEFTIVASGPLTSDKLYQAVAAHTGAKTLHFFDAVAPIVTRESLDFKHCYFGARYNKGTTDYINCPLNKDEYEEFWHSLVEAEVITVHDFDDQLFKDCKPIEEMARTGIDTMRFGPLRPVGLIDPETCKQNYAVLQLRQENMAGTAYSLVGFQTRLKFPEQKRVFGLIKALQHAEYLRYGMMHRNSYLESAKVLNCGLQSQKRPTLFFAGQFSGVEGYVESIASGHMAALVIAAMLKDKVDLLSDIIPGEETIIGALLRYLHFTTDNFQPMNANFGLLTLPPGLKLKKQERGDYYRKRSLQSLETTVSAIGKL